MPQHFRDLQRPERERIVLRTARDLFLAHGYSNTKMSDIAEAAGVTPAALYGYFASKDHALAAVQSDVEEEVMAQLPTASALNRLEAYLEIVRETSRPLHRMMHERAGHSEHVATVLAKVHNNIDQLISEAVASHGITNPNLERLVELCTAVIEGTNATRSPLHSAHLVRFAIERVRDATVAAPVHGPATTNGGSTPSTEAVTPPPSSPPEVHIERLDPDDIFGAVDAPTSRRLLDVAVGEFAVRGYGGTPTRRLTAQAGLSSTALYAHFRTKEAILHQISRLAHDHLLAAMRRASASAEDSLSSFLSVVGTFIRFHVDHSILARVIQYELRELSRAHMLEIATYRRQIDLLIRSCIEAGTIDDQFRCIDIAGTALAIESLAIDIARWHDGQGTDAARSAIVDRYLSYSLALVGAREQAISSSSEMLRNPSASNSPDSHPNPRPDHEITAPTGTVQ